MLLYGTTINTEQLKLFCINCGSIEILDQHAHQVV
jgi:hypothetical protein